MTRVPLFSLVFESAYVDSSSCQDPVGHKANDMTKGI